MDRLKLIIADKILEVSSVNPSEAQGKLRKIQRFTDFVDACKALMITYPEIELSLMDMVNENDFDTAKASQTVDAIISRHYHSNPVGENNRVEPAKHEVESMPISETPDQSFMSNDSIDEQNNLYSQSVVYSTVEEFDAFEPNVGEKRRKTNTLILQIIAAIIILFIVYLIFKFVVNYWKYILSILLLVTVFYGGWLYYKKRRK